MRPVGRAVGAVSFPAQRGTPVQPRALRTATACTRVGALALLAAMWLAACEAPPAEIDSSIGDYRERMLVQHQQEVEARQTEREDPARRRRDQPPVATPVASQPGLPAREALVTQPEATSQPAPAEVLAEIPDPREAEQVLRARLERVREQAREERVISAYQKVVAKALEYLTEMQHERQVELSLAECIQRALANNYSIRIEAHNPAISQTQLVEAEAAFDAVFFLDFNYDNADRPVPTQLASGQSDTRSLNGGFRQLLPTGMQVQTSLGQTRSFSDNRFVTINPAYATTFAASFTQPLLRGFGLDYNRAAIEVRKADVRISYETFIQRVRDTLLDVETAYWQVAQARRTAMILAEAVAQNWVTYQSMWERRLRDATPVEIANSRSRWQSRYVQYLEAIKLVRDAEDRLKNVMNDPQFRLSDDLEIITSETPLIAPLALDQLAEVRTAVEERSEIRAARERIEQARIQTQRAKNETLPQLDLAFNYEVQGLDLSADSSFDHMTSNRFRSYRVGVNFSYPLGDRGPQAALRRARLQESQLLVQLKQVADAVVEEVNAAVRQLVFRYRQVPPQLDSVVSAEKNLRTLQARAERIDPNFLQTELSAVESLTSSRQTLLQVVTDYNVAIVQLERAKGTLLQYNNVVVAHAPP